MPDLNSVPKRRPAARDAGDDNRWITTTYAGTITDLSESAAALLGFSVRGAIGQLLPLFFYENRLQVFADMRAAVLGPVIRRSAVAGRGRRPVSVYVTLSSSDSQNTLVWVFDE